MSGKRGGMVTMSRCLGKEEVWYYEQMSGKIGGMVTMGRCLGKEEV
jgi:hypothetical protein